MDWRPIPDTVDTSVAPFNGDDVLIWADSACTNIVRLAWWRDYEQDDLALLGDWTPEDTGWWSYQHSVTQEKLDYLKPTYWAPFEQPAPLMDEIAPGVMRR